MSDELYEAVKLQRKSGYKMTDMLHSFMHSTA